MMYLIKDQQTGQFVHSLNQQQHSVSMTDAQVAAKAFSTKDRAAAWIKFLVGAGLGVTKTQFSIYAIIA